MIKTILVILLLVIGGFGFSGDDDYDNIAANVIYLTGVAGGIYWIVARNRESKSWKKVLLVALPVAILISWLASFWYYDGWPGLIYVIGIAGGLCTLVYMLYRGLKR